MLTVVPVVLCGAVLTTAAVVGAAMADFSLATFHDVNATLSVGTPEAFSAAMMKVIPQLQALVTALSIACLVCCPIAVLAQSAVYFASEEVVRGGPRTSTWGTFVAGALRLPSVLAVTLVLGLVASVCTAPVVGLVVTATTAGSWALGVAAIPVGTVSFGVAIYLLLRLSLALPAAAVDELGPLAAIARAWQVSRGSLVDLAVATLLMLVATSALSLSSSLVFVVPVLGQIAAIVITLISLVAPHVWLMLAYAGLSDRLGHPGR